MDAVEDGENAQWLIAEKEYDLLILDWILPNISGIELCQYARQQGKAFPILILT